MYSNCCDTHCHTQVIQDAIYTVSFSLVAVVIDSYTHNNTLTSGGSVLLGTQLILVCWVVGLSYGTPHSYTWTCPNGPCEVEGYYGRKIYNEHILAVNTTSTSDKGTYTCQVTATGGQGGSGSFTLRITGMPCETAIRVSCYNEDILCIVIISWKTTHENGKMETNQTRPSDAQIFG